MSKQILQIVNETDSTYTLINKNNLNKIIIFKEDLENYAKENNVKIEDKNDNEIKFIKNKKETSK